MSFTLPFLHGQVGRKLKNCTYDLPVTQKNCLLTEKPKLLPFVSETSHISAPPLSPPKQDSVAVHYRTAS